MSSNNGYYKLIKRFWDGGAYIIDNRLIAGAHLSKDGFWEYTIINEDMKIIESGSFEYDGESSVKEALKICIRPFCHNSIGYSSMISFPMTMFHSLCKCCKERYF